MMWCSTRTYKHTLYAKTCLVFQMNWPYRRSIDDFPVEHWPMDIEGFRARLPGGTSTAPREQHLYLNTQFISNTPQKPCFSKGSDSAYIWGWVKTLVPFCSPQNSWDLWMFIPLKMVLIGIDPYPFGTIGGWCLYNGGWEYCPHPPWKVHLAASGDKSNWLG